MGRLALDREASAIQSEIERAGYRDSFEFVMRWAAGPLDLLRELRKLRPTVVHFSGYGASAVTVNCDARPRDVVGEIDPHGEPRAALFFADGRAQHDALGACPAPW